MVRRVWGPDCQAQLFIILDFVRVEVESLAPETTSDLGLLTFKQNCLAHKKAAHRDDKHGEGEDY